MIRYLIFILFFYLTTFISALTIRDNSIIDDFGNTIPLKEYKKVVILDPGVVETFYMIGAEDKIVAIGSGSKTKIYPEDKTVKLKNIGHMVNLNFENILQCNPDLVILNPMGSKTRDKLISFNIPVIINTVHNFNDILNNIEIYGKLTGNENNAQVLLTKTRKNLELLKNKITEKPLHLKGAILYSTSPIMAFKRDSLPGEILNFLNVENIADKLTGDKPILSQEYLLEQNPDFLGGAMMIKNSDNILIDNPILKETTAGKNNNVFLIDSTKTLRGSPRIFQALEDFYNQLDKISHSIQ